MSLLLSTKPNFAGTDFGSYIIQLDTKDLLGLTVDMVIKASTESLRSLQSSHCYCLEFGFGLATVQLRFGSVQSMLDPFGLV